MPRLDTPAEIETMLRESGGVEVVYQGTTTWGHFDERDVISDDQGTVMYVPTLMIATGIIDPVANAPITVDGTGFKLANLKPRRVDDGAMTRIILRSVA